MNDSQTVFNVRANSFEGPLELLLELVEKRKFLINDISLAMVTDEYIRTISELEKKSMHHISQFILIAATLLLIKSKSLLPVLTITEEEEDSIEDLENKLKYYQIFRDAGLQVQDNFGKKPQFERQEIFSEILFHPDSYCTVKGLHHSMLSVLNALPEEKPKKTVAVKNIISLEEMINTLKSRVEKELTLSFKKITMTEKEKKAIAVSFLAILELFKQGHVILRQQGTFHDIEIVASTQKEIV